MNALIQKEFAHLEPGYFNAAYMGPTPQRAVDAGKKSLERTANPVRMAYEEWTLLPTQLRKSLARLLRTKPQNIAHFSSAADLFSLIAWTYPWKPKDHVIFMDDEYPSLTLPFYQVKERYGLEITALSREHFRNPALLLQAIPPSAKVVVMSHAAFNSGEVFPVEKIGQALKERNIFFAVDGTQNLGGRRAPDPLETVCDVYGASTYKWLLGAYGHAFAFLSEQAQNTLTPFHIHWMNTQGFQDRHALSTHDFSAHSGAHRFDRGQAANTLGSRVLLASLSLMEEIGLEKIEQHNRELLGSFLENLDTTRFCPLAPLETLHHFLAMEIKKGNSEDLQKTLLQKGFDVSVRRGNLRISFHLFNSKEKTRELLAALHS